VLSSSVQTSDSTANGSKVIICKTLCVFSGPPCILLQIYVWFCFVRFNFSVLSQLLILCLIGCETLTRSNKQSPVCTVIYSVKAALMLCGCAVQLNWWPATTYLTRQHAAARHQLMFVFLQVWQQLANNRCLRIRFISSSNSSSSVCSLVSVASCHQTYQSVPINCRSTSCSLYLVNDKQILVLVPKLVLSAHSLVCSFVIAGTGPTYSWPQRWSLYIGPVRQPMERRRIGRCARCMCLLCRVEESLSRSEQFVRYF